MARSVLQDLAGNETLGQVDELLRLVKAAGREVVDDVRWGEDAAELTPKAAVPEGLDVEAGWAGADRSRACWRCTFLLPRCGERSQLCFAERSPFCCACVALVVCKGEGQKRTGGAGTRRYSESSV